MRHFEKTLALATGVLALPLLTLGQVSNTQIAQEASGSQAASMHTGAREAMRMAPANAELLHNLDTRKTQPGYAFQAKLSKTVHLVDGTALPSGTILLGTVVVDDMQQGGTSKLALRFTQAKLKDGKTIPIKATIVGIFQPQEDNAEGYPVIAGDQVPNSWSDGTLRVDQIGVLSGVDLHSNIASENSGVLVSTKKNNVKLNRGSEIQLAIAPRGKKSANTLNPGQD